MYCKHCGAEVHPSQAFCSKCGQVIEREAPGADPAPAAVAYAGFWERFAAQFLDGLLLWLASVPLGMLAAFFITPGSAAPIALFYLGWLVLYWLYFAQMESGERSATFGKRWLGLKVVSADDHSRISFGRATGRLFGRFLSAMLLYIGYLMQPFTRKRQTLHDMMSGTVVIRDGSEKKRWLVVTIAVLFFLLMTVGIVAAVSIPIYQEYTNKARITEAMALARQATDAVSRHYAETGTVPESLAAAGFTPELPAYLGSIEVNAENGIVVLALNGEQFEHAGLIMVPSQDERGEVAWACEYTGLPERLMANWPDCTPYQPEQGS